MPFVSQKQRRLCYAMQSLSLKEGKKPTWNCEKWEKETSDKNLPLYKGMKVSKSRLTKSPSEKKIKRKIHIGPRGGKYVIYNGRKVYV
jgi:hypothetical protein